jgi:hypothetical protein
LPQIQEELQALLRETENLIGKLPKAPSNDALSEVLSLLQLFVRDLEKHLEGTPDHDGLVQSIRPAREKFKKAVRFTAPDFRPYEKKYAKERTFSSPDFLGNEEDYSEKEYVDTFHFSEKLTPHHVTDSLRVIRSVCTSMK